MNANRNLDAVVAGYLGVDLLPQLKCGPAAAFGEIFRPGKLVETGPLEMSLGGAVPNTGLALQRFGARIELNGLVGTDRLGDVVVQLLSRYGNFTGIRRTDASETAYGVVLAPPGLDRMFLESTGCNNLFCAEHVDFEATARARMFHLGYPPLMAKLFGDGGGELERILARVRRGGTATSMDMALPDPEGAAGRVDWTEILARTLPHVDFFLPIIEEILFMLDPSRYEEMTASAGDGDVVDVIPDDMCAELADACLRMGARVVVLKAGTRGLWVASGETRDVPLDLPSEPWANQSFQENAATVDLTRFQNACGAGDACIAGFLAGVLRGESLQTCARLAAAAGRDSVYGTDTLKGLRDWSEMRKEIQST